MNKNLFFLIFAISGGVLLILNIAYTCTFFIGLNLYNTGSVDFFRANLFLNLLITLIIVNALYLIGLGVYLGIRFFKHRGSKKV